MKTPTDWTMSDIAYANGMFVAVGRTIGPAEQAKALIVTSTDGLLWQEDAIGVATN
jgi:hypothetical protein